MIKNEEMQFLSCVEYKPNTYFQKLEQIAKFDGIVGIYGAGVMGKKLCQILLHYNITPDCYIVDNEYLDTAELVLEGCTYPVVDINKFLKLGKKRMVLNAIELHNNDYIEKFSNVTVKFKGCEVVDFEHINLFICKSITFDYFMEHWRSFFESYQLFEDELSKRTYIEFLNANIQQCSIVLDSLSDEKYHQNDYDYNLLFNRNSGCIIECGAYRGETTLQMIDKVSDEIVINSIEPDAENYFCMKDRLKNIKNIHLYQYGVLDFDGQISFDGEGGTAHVSKEVQDDDKLITVRKLDSLFLDREVMSIVMDIEGSELDALKGAHDIIEKYRPTLGIRIYHKEDDLITIPQYIYNEFKDKNYKLYLRKNTLNRGYMDTTLYAV